MITIGLRLKKKISKIQGLKRMCKKGTVCPRSLISIGHNRCTHVDRKTVWSGNVVPPQKYE